MPDSFQKFVSQLPVCCLGFDIFKVWDMLPAVISDRARQVKFSEIFTPSYWFWSVDHSWSMLHLRLKQNLFLCKKKKVWWPNLPFWNSVFKATVRTRCISKRFNSFSITLNTAQKCHDYGQLLSPPQRLPRGGRGPFPQSPARRAPLPNLRAINHMANSNKRSLCVPVFLPRMLVSGFPTVAVSRQLGKTSCSPQSRSISVTVVAFRCRQGPTLRVRFREASVRGSWLYSGNSIHDPYRNPRFFFKEKNLVFKAILK